MNDSTKRSVACTERLVLLLEYDGTAFQGNQWQDNGPTVQAALEEALAALNVPVIGRVAFAGRTDAGVHALGQVAHVDVAAGGLETYPELATSLNHFLPPTVAVGDWHLTSDPTFHATTCAQWRWYRYRILETPTRSAFIDKNAAWIRPWPKPLDLSRMQAGLEALMGIHNFEAFGCAKKEVNDVVCALAYTDLFVDERGYVTIDLIGNRFIYKMVRSIVGTLLLLGRPALSTPDGQAPSSDLLLSTDESDIRTVMRTILAEGDRSQAGATAKPEGLSLQAVLYPPPWDFFNQHLYVKTMTLQIQELSSNEQKLLSQVW
ncbi:MAG: tRNA pseudouridine synthase A [Cyanobacteria bacterium HKST-UBA04]|nr:tRNA pseudouridine synthase A [Cyanobacteria bacterium HKST-UBA04]MCA9841791.1 tRNA pseudouridine synthase A [Cyanobacteria bacterium HKST-UBA03]